MRIFYEPFTGNIMMASSSNHAPDEHIEYPYIDIPNSIQINAWKVNLTTLQLEAIEVKPFVNPRIANSLT